MALMRLQKYLSRAGVCSRRKAETYIRSGRIRVNGQTVAQLGTKVDTEKDEVYFDETPVAISTGTVYLAFNKPRGVVSSCEHRGESVVTDFIDMPVRVYPVGRLDKESTGLILLTNDGALHHRLSHPSFDHEKEYEVGVDGPVSDQSLNRLADGVTISGRRTRTAGVKRLSPATFRIILKEGRNRQIRRMAGAIGRRVITLKRVRISGIHLGGLAEGKWRHLTEAEKKIILTGLEKDS
ncbi:MAG: rRNA pseudouridine synthase [Desulfobacteraceae bacterium]|nr:rRNA pseudouridine synthase [Desulfobacteraceae bacterium]